VRLDILPMMLKLSDALPGDSPEAVSTVKSLTHALLTLASDPACIAELASGGALVIMKRAAQICLDDDEVMYETASLMYLFASTSAASRLCSANAEGAFILQKLGARSNVSSFLSFPVHFIHISQSPVSLTPPFSHITHHTPRTT
jgi:hypothetical protein